VPQQISPPPRRLYSGTQTRGFDSIAIDEHGIPGIVLMKRAGQAAFDALCSTWPDSAGITVVCGKGNNAGDGYIIAGLAGNQGMNVQLVQLGAASQLQGDAGLARDWALDQGVVVVEVDADAPAFVVEGDVVVDALLGTGLSGDVRPGYAQAVALLNADAAPVLAVDVPSGVCADTGRVLGCAVRADLTVTFVGVKQGLCTGAAIEHVGRVRYADLDVPEAVFAGQQGIEVLDWQSLRRALGERAGNAYKNSFGHVLIVGGDLGMGGAVALAGEAALRCGAGLVSVVTRPEHVAPVLARRPELMVVGTDAPARVEECLAKADVLAVGPGLGRAAWGQRLLERVFETGKPCVIDADALNLLAQAGLDIPVASVLTPHPGEAARLLGSDNQAVQADRLGAARDLATRYQATVVLKGAGSLIAEPDGTVGICLLGNPGMATAGMGDVLTGIIAGLSGRMAVREAARTGTCLHSAAADRVVASQGERGLIAADVVAALVAELNADS
jgi:NAD(P)H-hydrate epimerase